MRRVSKAQATAASSSSGECQGEDSPKKSHADLLVELAQDADLFHTPGGCDSEAYASIMVNGHRETWAIRSKGFRRWLGRRFHQEHEKVPSSQALQDALNVITGKAIFDGLERPIHVRLAEHEGAIYYDLADTEWRAVAIRSVGWDVVESEEVPVRFIRRRGMLPQVEPERGGGIGELRLLVNLSDEEWILFVGSIVGNLRATGPFTVDIFNGEQGSAKSTLCRIKRALVDPAKPALRRPPKDDRDLMIAASNSWLVTYDNMSAVPASLSDSICSLATGGGFGTRQLYTDEEEKLFDEERPVTLNGISDLTNRGDLLDRSIIFTLPPIGDTEKRRFKDVWQDFEAVRPAVLGAFFDAVAMALRRADEVRLDNASRNADFATWVVAAEPALPWAEGTFMDAYLANRRDANTVAIESSLISPVIIDLMDSREIWSGTFAELLEELDSLAGEKLSKRQEWPKTPRKLSADLRRLAPNLRRVGVNVVFGKRSNRGTIIGLEKRRDQQTQPSQPSPDTATGLGSSVGGDHVVTVHGSQVTEDVFNRHTGTRPGGRQTAVSDGSDGRGGLIPTLAEDDPEEVVEWTG